MSSFKPVSQPDKPVSLLPSVMLYAQTLGSETYSHDTSYSLCLVRNPQSISFETLSLNQSAYDYAESSSITSLKETEVITDTEFIMIDKRKARTVINGTIEMTSSVRLLGDDTYTTYIDKINMHLLKRDSSGNDTQIVFGSYEWSTAPSTSAAVWSDLITATVRVDTSENVSLLSTDRLVYRIEVFGHVDSASASDNKIRLYYTRGTDQTFVFVPVDEVVHQQVIVL